MSQSNNIKFIDRAVLVLFMMFFTLYEMEEMFLSEDVGNTTFVSHSFIPLAALLIALAYTVIRGKVKHNIFSILFLITFGVIFIISVGHNLILPFQSKLRYVTLSMPIVLLLFAYKWRMTETTDTFMLFVLNTSVVVLLWHFFNLYSLTSFNGFRTMGAYTLLMFLPFVLMLKSKIIKWTIAIAIFLALLVSLKRGGVISFALAIIAYFAVRSIISSKHILNTIVIFLIGIIIVSIFVYVDQLLLENQLFERLINMQNDSGSGRMQVYRDVVQMIITSSESHIILGHGWDQVIAHQPDHFSAHNDYLEVLYDCGILGFIPLVALLVSMFIYLRRLIIRKSSYAPAMAAMLTAFMCNSTISHVILYAKFMSVVALAYGFMMAAEQQEQNATETATAK